MDFGFIFDDIDVVVVGKVFDFFEGVMMLELFMVDVMGVIGKLLIWVYIVGLVGGFIGVVVVSLV